MMINSPFFIRRGALAAGALLGFMAITASSAPQIAVSIEIGCLTLTGCAGNWSKQATGARSQGCPAFCYRITVTNSGSDIITNVAVLDTKLDLTGCAFTTTLAPNTASRCIVPSVTRCESTTNSVMVSGQSALSGERVTALDSAAV